MNRYVVIGAGAIGASLSAQFELNGIPYLLFGRGEQIRHIRDHGLTYVRPGETRRLRLQTCEQLEQLCLGEEDILVVATKSQDVEAVCRRWAWLPLQGDTGLRIAADLPLLTLQNGLASERTALRWFGQVYGGSINTPARFTRVGEVVVGGDPEVGLVVVGPYPRGEGGLAGTMVRDLCRAGYLAEASDDIGRWKAAKLIQNMRNALDLFAGDPARIAAFNAQLVQEARAVFAAMGLEPADPQERRQKVAHWGVAAGSGIAPGQQSTWQSIARGVPSEVDYLNGEIVLLGRLHGVRTPFNGAVQRMLGQLEVRGTGLEQGSLGHIEPLWALAGTLAQAGASGG